MRNIRYNNFEKWNDEMIKKFDLEHYHNSSNFVIRFIESRRVKCVLMFISPSEKDKIIEIGCGAGDILGKIKKGSLTGLDISQYIIDRAKKRFKKISFIVGNAQNLPQEVKKRQFDKIICSEVLEHVEEPERVLKEIKKISRKESIVVISIPNEGLINKIKAILQKLRIFGLFFPKLSRKMNEEWHLHAFSFDRLRTMASSDYIIIKAQGVPYNWIPLRYVLKMKIK